MRRPTFPTLRCTARRLPGVALAVVAVAAAAVVVTQAESGSPVSAEVACVPYVYAGDGSQIEVIDQTTNTMQTAITGSFSTTTGLAVSPDGATLYIAELSSDEVSVVDTATRAVTATVTGLNYPAGIAISPDGTRLYVANLSTNFRGTTVSIIDTTTNPPSITSTLSGLDGPYGIGVSPDGTRIYVANYSSASVDVFRTSDNSKIANVPVGSGARTVAVSPDGSRAYVASESGSVTVIDTTSFATTTIPLPLGSLPHWLALSPDGKTLYVTLYATAELAVISTADNSVTRVSLPNTNPFPVAVSADGQRVYVGAYGAGVPTAVWVFATSDNSVLTTLPLGWAWGIAVDRCGAVSPPPPSEYTASGFFAPVRMGGVTNTVQAGSNLPLKFRVSAGAQVISSLDVVTSLTVDTVSCPGPTATRRPSSASTDLLPGLRFDAASQQFAVNWKTPKVRNTCYTVTATMADGDTLVASVRAR